MQAGTAVNQQKISNNYRNYVLVVLTLVYVFNFLDRQLLVILQESIKKELHLSDTQLGLLSGFTFAIFYVVLGIPIARFADKGNRRNTVAVSLGLWSVMTAFSGLARNFTQLLLARVGVGVGEAGGSPPAHAMISDYFPPEKTVNRAFGLLNGYLYRDIGRVFNGGVFETSTWAGEPHFFVLGIPGLIFSLLFYATIKEPQRGATDANAATESEPHSLDEVLKLLYATKTFVYLSIGTGLHVFCIYGLINWAPSFLARLHGMKATEIGVSLGLIFGIGGGIGTFAGGFLTDYFGKKDKRLYLKIPAYAIVLSIVFAAGTLFFTKHVSFLILFGFMCFIAQHVPGAGSFGST